MIFFIENALMNGTGCALYYNGESRSHAQLFDDACRLTNGMAKLNLAPGTRVAVAAKNHPAFFHLFAAASALNLCLVLINRRLGMDELAHALDDTQAQAVIYDDSMEAGILPLIQDRPGVTCSFNLAGSFSTLYAPDTHGAVELAGRF